MNRFSLILLLALFLAAAAAPAGADDRALGYLSIPGGGTLSGGGPIPIYESPDDAERSALRYDREAFFLCEVLDNTPVEIFEDDRERLEFRGTFIKVRILEGRCRDKTGWVAISNVHRMLP